MNDPRPLRRVDLSEATWRGRAVRYVLIYLALALALVGARYLTQDIRPALRAVQEREATLLTRRNDLAVRVQALENPQRIRDWAFANGMVRFAEAPKEAQAILPLPPRSAPPPPGAVPAPSVRPGRPAQPDTAQPDTAQPNAAQPDNTVEVRTQWR